MNGINISSSVTIRMAICLRILLIELDEVIHVITTPEENWAPLMYACRDNIEDATSPSGGDTTSLREPYVRPTNTGAQMD